MHGNISNLYTSGVKVDTRNIMWSVVFDMYMYCKTKSSNYNDCVFRCSKCPWQLANHVSLKTVDNMKKMDLSDFYEEMHDDEPKIQSGDGDNKDQTETGTIRVVSL